MPPPPATCMKWKLAGSPNTEPTSAAVRDFAQHMVEAHTQTTDQLKSILAENNIQIAPPAHPTTAVRA